MKKKTSTLLLMEGTTAPQFVSKDFMGNTIALKDFRGKKILLCFFRDASCPFCNLRVNELIRNASKLEKLDIQIVTFFASNVENIQKYAGTQNPPFPVIPDPNYENYRRYGVGISFKAKMKTLTKMKKISRAVSSKYFNLYSFSRDNVVPADFMINKDLTINRVYYGKDFGDHIPIAEILNWR